MVSDAKYEALIASRQNLGGKKSDHVYEIIKRAILYRHFEPEVQLREQELARQFSCSQGTVREALMRLADDGLVERSGYRGTRVTRLRLRESVEMVKVRLSIEQAAVRELQRTGLAEARAVLEALTLQMDEATRQGDFLHASELDRAFHDRVMRAAGMELLSPILQRCSLHIHRYTMGGMEVPRDSFQSPGIGSEHRVLLDELDSGDAGRAEQAILGHMAQVLRRWAPSLFEAIGPEAFRGGGGAWAPAGKVRASAGEPLDGARL